MTYLVGILLLLALPFSSGIAQESGKTPASTLEVFVFPAAWHPYEQQSKDEAKKDRFNS